MSEKREFGPFEIEKQLGVGGMGIVYQATYLETGQRVALKVLTPAVSSDAKFIQRFEREIDILKRLQHPNVVRYFGGGRHEHQRYYAMEYIDGGTLEDILVRKGRLTWEQTLDVGRQVCSALEHSHSHGIIHRDLKPANLFLSKKGRLKVGDFGIARDTEATALTAAGKTVGSYHYMAPEQITGKGAINRKTDLYALGCVLFELVTGRKVFAGENPAELLFQHLEDDPPDAREFALDCPIWLEQIIDRLLAKEPDDRPFDALAVHTELGEIREKLKEQASVTAQTVDGRTSTEGTENWEHVREAIGVKDAKGRVKKRKKKKKREFVPIYEQSWFLGGCLVLVLAGAAWAMWPDGPDEIHDRIVEQMKVDDYVRRDVRQDIEEYQDRFPDGPHTEELKNILLQLDLEDILNRRGRNIPESVSMFQKAWEYREFGDLGTAKDRFTTIVDQFAGDDEARKVVDAAQHEIDNTAEERFVSASSVIYDNLHDAETMFADKNVKAARDKWKKITELYSGIDDLSKLVTHAELRLDGKDVELLPLDEMLAAADEPSST